MPLLQGIDDPYFIHERIRVPLSIMKQRIVCIGGGNMGGAIIGGLLAQGYKKELISIVDPDADAQQKISQELGLTVEPNLATLKGTDVVLLAVKPQIMKPVVEQLAPLISDILPVFISIAAGITTAQLARWLRQEVPIVRVMPNTPALVGQGAAALFATPNVTQLERDAALAIISAVGIAEWVDDEDLLDIVTAVSGSGPAYYFLIMELLEKIAIELGLDAQLARKLSIETAHGAALLARQSTSAPSTLREQVTSPGGTTESALKVLSKGNIESLFRNALIAAHQRSRELAAGSE